jgi:Flp pilus assembly protein protease CpaA
MSTFEIWIISAVLATCVYVSYTDIKYRKIGNLCTYGLVLFGLVCQGISIYIGATSLPEVLWLLLGGLAIAFLMYYLGIWAPGDSKLFWGVSMALPPTLYHLGWWRYPPFLIAVNTFVPYFLLMALVILVETTWDQKRQVLQGILTPRFLLRLSLSIICFTGLSTLLNLLLPFSLDYFSALILFVVLFTLFDRLVEKEKQFYFLLPFSLVSIWLAVKDPRYFIISTGITIALFLVLRFFVASLGDYLFVKEVDVSRLVSGVVPADVIMRDGEGHYDLHEVPFTSFISIASRPRDGQVIMDITPEGLSEEKVAELKELARQGHFATFGDKIKVQKAVPFAPIVTVGVVLTIISRGIFLERLIELISR